MHISAISFTVEPPGHRIVPVIDGHTLIALITTFEQEHGLTPPGGYGGIIPEHFNYGPLEQYFCGESQDPFWRESEESTYSGANVAK